MTVTLEHALELYGLHSFELLWEKALDTKVLLAWSDSTCVLSFRGTSSWANVMTDLEVRVPPEPTLLLLSTPTFFAPELICNPTPDLAH